MKSEEEVKKENTKEAIEDRVEGKDPKVKVEMRHLSTIEEIRSHFGNSIDPIIVIREGKKREIKNLQEANELFGIV